MFGLEGTPVYGAEAREVVEGRSVLITEAGGSSGYPVPAIRFTGRRAGEELGEELIADGETPPSSPLGPGGLKPTRKTFKPNR